MKESLKIYKLTWGMSCNESCLLVTDADEDLMERIIEYKNEKNKNGDPFKSLKIIENALITLAYICLIVNNGDDDIPIIEID